MNETSYTTNEVLRYAAFTDVPTGGNPAGVVLDAHGLTEDRMLAIAAEVGYSETAFLVPSAEEADAASQYRVRYFSPVAEVPFCGHATIATGVALAEKEGPGDLTFHTNGGPVPVRTSVDEAGAVTATLTSVAPKVEMIELDDVREALRHLNWSMDELDHTLPPRIAYAGARHLIMAAASRERLGDLDYDFDGLRGFMVEHDLTTVDLVWRRYENTYDARNPFPVGGVVEDPATGAAAAAFGAYLRELGLVTPPAVVHVQQGDDIGRPSRLTIEIAEGRPEVEVTGRAVAIETPTEG